MLDVTDPNEWLKPSHANPWHPFIDDRRALEIIEAEIRLLEQGRL